MTVDQAELPPGDGPRFRRARRWAIGIAATLLVALAVLWTQRKPIAASYVGGLLAERGVTARYDIADLGLGRQRLTNVVLGDPAKPDLVADWIELRTDVGFDGAAVTGVRAGHVRVRARLVDGKLSLGAIDRLMPAPSGKPFALPAIDLRVADGRMRLETPYGVAGLRLSGSGRLDDGFRGTLAAVSERIEAQGCQAERLAMVAEIAIEDRRPGFTGPIRAGSFACGGVRGSGASADLALTLDEALDRWSGTTRVRLARLAGAGGAAEAIDARVRASGGPSRTTGTIESTTGRVAHAELAAAGLSAKGSFVLGGGMRYRGQVGATGAALGPALARRIAEWGGAAEGTPVAPLLVQAADALDRAGRAFDLNADVDVTSGAGSGRLLASRVQIAGAGGARLTLSSGRGAALVWPDPRVQLDGLLALGGGGLPEVAIRLAQAAPGAPASGTAVIAPYSANGARLALDPVRFSVAGNGATRIVTRAALSGPLASGRVDGAVLPIEALWNGGARISLNPGCAPLRFDRLAVSGLTLGPTRLALCPAGPAMVTVDGSRISGGVRAAAPRLQGAIGSSPLTLAADEVRFGLAERGFSATGLAVGLGRPDRLTELRFAAFSGALAAGGAAGRFAGGAGQIAKVPLLLSDAAGEWRWSGGGLSARAGVMVADAAPNPRFRALSASQMQLALQGDRITASGALLLPTKQVKVADVTIVHDLGRGEGQADLTVPGISFGDSLQPEELTRLTFGVIAEVKGTIAGEGRIRWTPTGVTSTGTFRTAGTDLAAAFGPVTGLKGEIRFSDLLGLETAPGQTATVASVNPGVPVTDGLVRYRLLPGLRIQVEGARWPFAGGELVLEPTVLDFAENMQRRMTFRVTGVDAQQFLQQFDFKNLNATGTFDGVLPMVFDQSGGRIEGGHLDARTGGGTIAYVGEVTQEDVGFWGNVAFQALKSLRYGNVAITMNGPLAGEMITQVRFAGVSQGEGAKSNFLIRRLARLPFVFNVRIKAPFRALIDSARSFYEPSRLIERNLPALIREQQRREGQTIQPPASEDVP